MEAPRSGTIQLAVVLRFVDIATDALAGAREEIDALNVYPVPDGDTGTNLQLTMQSAAEAVHAAPADMAATTKAMAHGALMGARGNSGVILSQIVRGNKIDKRIWFRSNKSNASFAQDMALNHPIAIMSPHLQSFTGTSIQVRMLIILWVIAT